MKYHNKKTVIDGIKFDSKREATRYVELMLLQKSGKITGLVMQQPFELAPAVKFSDERRKKPALRYIADFVYTCMETQKIVVEDVKSSATAALAEFRTKRHLMLALRGIEVKVTT